MDIKKYFSKIGSNLKDLFKQYPITLIIVLITTLMITFLYDTDDRSAFIFKTLMFFIIWAFGTFFSESAYKDKVNKIISIVVTGIISFIFIRLGYYEGHLFSLKSAVFHEILFRILVCYLIALFMISMYKIFKKSELKFSEFILKVFTNMFITSIMYGVLAIGIFLLSIIFIYLILNDNYSIDIIPKTQILLFGFFYVPAVIYSITAKNKEISNFIKNIMYVLLTLVSIAVAILYMYIVKIIIEQDIPSNFIYRIIAGIFVFLFPVWVMASNYEENNKIVKKVIHILPYAFMPLVLLETYSITVRSISYGITPNRYLCFAFIILQVIAIVLWIYKKQSKMHHIFIYIVAIIIITTISPFNMYHISAISQRNILLNDFKEGTDFNKLDYKTKARVRGAYQYIRGLSEEDKYMPDYIKNNKEFEAEYYSYNPYTDKRSLYYYDDDSETIITGYDTLNTILISGTKNKLEVINGYDRNKLDIESISNYLSMVLEQSKGREAEYVKNNRYIMINEDQVLFITQLSISMFDGDDDSGYISIQGYLLTKNK